MKAPFKTAKSHFPKAIVLALAISSVGTLPAAADECLDMIGEVTQAISGANLTSDAAVRVENFRISAIKKQAEGDVDGCVADLQEASALLNLE